MIAKNDAFEALLKNLNGTMSAAGLSLDAQENETATFSGDAGEVKLELNGIAMEVSAKKGSSDYKTVDVTLFEPETADWNEQDTRSAANSIADSVAKFFGTELIYATGEGKSKSAAKEMAEVKAVEEKKAAAPKTKKKAKKEAPQYGEINLAGRMESIFPALAGETDAMLTKYGTFLPETYFAKVTPYVVNAIAKEDRPVMKRLFKAFNTFYDEGEKDMQSLIVVSILGTAMGKDATLLPKCQEYMSEDLEPAVTHVVAYLSKHQKKVEKLENPKPYTEPTGKKIKKAFKKVFGVNVNPAAASQDLLAKPENKK